MHGAAEHRALPRVLVGGTEAATLDTDCLRRCAKVQAPSCESTFLCLLKASTMASTAPLGALILVSRRYRGGAVPL